MDELVAPVDCMRDCTIVGGGYDFGGTMKRNANAGFEELVNSLGIAELTATPEAYRQLVCGAYLAVRSLRPGLVAEFGARIGLPGAPTKAKQLTLAD